MSSVTPAGGLVGRENELALLNDLLREAARGRGSAVLIEGEPGIGKSALIRAATAQARDAGCEVFWGTGDELGQELPLLPFLDGMRVRAPSGSARRQAILRLMRGEIAVDRGTDVPAALAEQLLALITEQCAVRPAVLVIDDLQWADRASVALWGRLARLAEQLSLLLIGMMRPVPQRDDLLALRRSLPTLTRLPLSALADTEVAELVESLAGGKPDADLLQLADGAAGNPLYLTELLAALVRGDGVTISEAGTAQLAGHSAPRSLAAAIADRLGFVAGPVREVLRAAALLGMDFAVADLATVLGRTVAELIPALDEACAAGVLVECGAELAFRHPLIRGALYAEMAAPVRAAWHRDAGRALARAGAPVDRVARQLLRAVGQPDNAPAALPGPPMDDWMVAWLTGAAEQLVGQAPGVAAELLSRAVATTAVTSDRYGWLASRLADALFRIGRTAQAEEVATRTLEHTGQPELHVDLHWTLAQCRGLAGLSAESLATLDNALAEPGISDRHRARLLVPAARGHFHLGEVERAGQVATDALSAATQATDSWAMGWSLMLLAAVESVQGRMAEALPLFDRALAATQSDPALTDLRLLLQINKAVTLGNIDRYEDALSSALQARHLANQAGTVIRLAQAHGALGQLLFETGRWDEALTEVRILADELKEPAAACCDLATAAVISFHRGDVEAARRHLSLAIPHASRLANRFIGPLALAHSLDHEREGALPEALAALTAGIDGTEELEQIEDLLGDGVRLAMQTGEPATATSLTEHATTLAAESPIPHRQANALYCRGMLEHDPHKLMAAAARYEDASRPLLQAKALEAAAIDFVALDERGLGRDAFTRAVEVYEALGAAADVARVLATFRSHGIRRGPHSKHRQASSGWDSLTPMEAKVAAFVEEGLSNPDIAAKLMLSRRTVGTHVSHILKKLGVSSRTDIARESALRSVATR